MEKRVKKWYNNIKEHANRHKNTEVKIEKKAKKYQSQLNEEIKKR